LNTYTSPEAIDQKVRLECEGGDEKGKAYSGPDVAAKVGEIEAKS
jgi:hypothetical protein